jgi:murein endopeptidase
MLALCVVAVAAVGAAYALGDRGEADPPRLAAPPGLHEPTAPRAGDAGSARGRSRPRPPVFPRVRYRDSRAIGAPHAGSLVNGTRLPARGRHFATWDPILRRSPNRRWRRHGTDDLVRLLIGVQRAYSRREPGELPMLIGDLSRPQGGDFGIRYGIVGHSTHQNGLDADVYYPRKDRRLRVPRTVAQVDRRLAQRLVDLFVAAGAEKVLVGPNLALTGPSGVVVPYPNHDNHLHVRIRNPGA